MNSIVTNVYWAWEGALSKEFCDFALSQVDWSEATTGETYYGVEPGKRITDVVWQPPMDPLGCIAKTYIDAANFHAGWNYSLLCQEDTQIGRYRGDNKGHYAEHIDTEPPKDGVQRKLSISILLSDPSEFEGGELQFADVDNCKVLTKQGSIVVFPSFIEHVVTPVTKGVRCSAVTWALGPAFR
jgi:PKHD-type hydroxylase